MEILYLQIAATRKKVVRSLSLSLSHNSLKVKVIIKCFLLPSPRRREAGAASAAHLQSTH